MRPSVALVALVAVACFHAAGCNRLLGIDDTTIGDPSSIDAPSSDAVALFDSLDALDGPIDSSDGSVSTATDIAGGGTHTCAVRAGQLHCWGGGGYGQLGYGGTNNLGDNERPNTIGAVAVGAPVMAVATGGVHTCVLTAALEVKCWGQGDDGRLGYGDTADRSVPMGVVLGGVAQVVSGVSHTCARLGSGFVQCWGNGSNGQLGYASVSGVLAPTTNLMLGGGATSIVAGDVHTCAVLTNGIVQCWGLGTDGRLGYGNDNSIGDNEHPSNSVVTVGGVVTQLAAGTAHTCALVDTGSVRCWGKNDKGQLGYGNLDTIGDNETPASAGDVPLGGPAQQIVAGGEHTCALMLTGDVRCWGEGTEGQLGYGNPDHLGDNELIGMTNVSIGGTATRITAGNSHTCAMFANADAVCWGFGTFGALGYGNTFSIGDSETPNAAGTVQYY